MKGEKCLLKISESIQKPIFVRSISSNHSFRVYHLEFKYVDGAIGLSLGYVAQTNTRLLHGMEGLVKQKRCEGALSSS